MKHNPSPTNPFTPYLLILITINVVAFACAPPPSINTPIATTAISEPTPIEPVPLEASLLSPTIISIEYAILGVAEKYAATGVSYAKLQDIFAVWENIEPEPGQYHWGPLDAIILEYQQAGFTGLQMNLTAKSPWASSQQPTFGNLGNTFPKEEYLDEYITYVQAVVERYDHDGINDMQGLLYPIHDYGIEREFTGYWPSTAEEYVRLLRIAYPAIKSVDSDARVLLVALLMADIFNGNPSQTEIDNRLNIEIDYMRKSVPEIRTILAACDAYDIVDFHALANYTEIPLTAAWIREELQSNGCGEKPIWIGDAFPMSALVGFGGFVPPTPFAPVTLDRRDEVVSLLTAMADPASPDHVPAQAWLYAEMAIGLVRKIVVSAGEGLLGINIGNLEDWKTGLPAIDKTTVPMLGATMFMGMTDTTITTQKPGGELPLSGKHWAYIRKTGNPRPIYFALQEVNKKIGTFTAVEKRDLGENIWSYRFETPNGPVWVLWYDDYKLYLPNETLPSLNVQLPFEFVRAIVTRTPTEMDRSEPETQRIDTQDGLLSIVLDATPLFVEVSP